MGFLQEQEQDQTTKKLVQENQDKANATIASAKQNTAAQCASFLSKQQECREQHIELQMMLHSEMLKNGIQIQASQCKSQVPLQPI